MSEIQRASMTEQEAHRLTERIRIAAVNYTEAKEKLLKLVSEAKDGAAHEALGYKSWTAYLADVMSEEPLRLARDERREVVQLLTEEGMSTRAIAPIVGAAQSTVVEDKKSTDRNRSVETHREVESLDGKTRTYPAPSAPSAESALSPDEVYDEETGEIISTTPEPEKTPEQKKIDKDLTLINDIRLYLGHMSRSRQVKNMSPTAKQHIINALEDTISAIKGETS